ncbi:DEAD/DEAH box helicase [Acrocarpospora macrocephala]|nr:DEAD/DEAH box helicase family protein [Acrocarpospora macrocephala]
MAYVDSFSPRPFQGAVSEAVIDGIRTGSRDVTIVLASPGSGKTLAYQALATRLIREGLIDVMAVFVPRIALAQQCETGWMHRSSAPGSVAGLAGMCLLFNPARRFGMIRHRTNESPLTNPSEHGSGFVATYSALAINESIFLEWARKYRGRFLLVADEAQFCGAARNQNEDDNGGTKAGALVTLMHQHARHTLLLTGTAYRADNQPLILAEYEEPNAQGRRPLITHAAATYPDGIAEGYLRTFEMKLVNAAVKRHTVGDPSKRMAGEQTLLYNLSDDAEDLAEVLKEPKVWQPLTDHVVAAVKDKQKFHPAYRGLISCMGQPEARAVMRYLKDQYPELKVGLAVSADGAAAAQALQEFRSRPMDILVTVRMAFIGYDCPQITVVGMLTHYRDAGHLMQLAGRGLRVWDKMPAREQSCRIIAPDDPRMQQFLDVLRNEREDGLRQIKEQEERVRDAPDQQQPLSYIASAEATTVRAASNDVDIEADDLVLIEYAKIAVDSGEDATKLKKILDLLAVKALERPDTTTSPRTEPEVTATVHVPKTEKQQIEELKSQAAAAVTKHLYKLGFPPGCDGYAEVAMKVTATVNTAAGIKAAEIRTVAQAEARLRAALKL